MKLINLYKSRQSNKLKSERHIITMVEHDICIVNGSY